MEPWNNDSVENLAYSADSFTVVRPDPWTLKVYMPMMVERLDVGCQEVPLATEDAVLYVDNIIKALEEANKDLDPERGLMKDCEGDESMLEKMRSYTFTAEVRENQLWGVAVCQIKGELTPEELEIFIGTIAFQACDEFGQNCAEKPFLCESNFEYYFRLWNEESWDIMPENERFDPEYSQKLPALCWSTLPDDGSLVYIKRGETGYHLIDRGKEKTEYNRRRADLYNRQRGISKTQEQAMLVGCTLGWDVPGANPGAYEHRDPPKMTNGMALE